MIITLIPKYNQTPERLTQLSKTEQDYVVVSTIFEALVWILKTKNVKALHVWYPHHFWLAIIYQILGKKVIFSPVLTDPEWFLVMRDRELSFNKYAFKRLRMTLYASYLVNFGNLVLTQDSQFIPIWKSIYFGVNHKKFKVIFNRFCEVNYSTGKKYGCLLVSHDAPHKIYYLEKMLKKIGKAKLTWLGSVKGSTVEKYSNRVDFKGKVNRNDLVKFYGNSDYLLIPSIYEGSPRVFYESFYSGVIPIFEDLRGLHDIRLIFKAKLSLGNVPASISEQDWNDIREIIKYTNAKQIENLDEFINEVL